MLFKLTNKKAGRSTHCGVLEFVADEGKIYLPHWVRSSDNNNNNNDKSLMILKTRRNLEKIQAPDGTHKIDSCSP